MKVKSWASDNNVGDVSSVKIRSHIFPAAFSCKNAVGLLLQHFSSTHICCLTVDTVMGVG